MSTTSSEDGLEETRRMEEEAEFYKSLRITS
jgi:hypothetical protein